MNPTCFSGCGNDAEWEMQWEAIVLTFPNGPPVAMPGCNLLACAACAANARAMFTGKVTWLPV